MGDADIESAVVEPVRSHWLKPRLALTLFIAIQSARRTPPPRGQAGIRSGSITVFSQVTDKRRARLFILANNHYLIWMIGLAPNASTY